jgi:AraC-like DNA-binding protein
MSVIALPENLVFPQKASVGEIVYPPGSTYGPRVQPSLQLVMVHSGSVNLLIDKQNRKLPKNSVGLLFPGHQEYFVFDRHLATHHSWLHFYLPAAGFTLLQELKQLPDLINFSAEMLALIRQALLLRYSPLSTAEAMLKTLALQMLYLFVGEAERAKSGVGENSQIMVIEQVQHYIHSYLAEAVTSEQLAKVAGVSQTHLNRLFKARLNITPIEYLWQQRVEKGIELLINTGLSVTTISGQCGFQTTHHFARRIAQHTGLSPRELRKQGWQPAAMDF